MFQRRPGHPINADYYLWLCVVIPLKATPLTSLYFTTPTTLLPLINQDSRIQEIKGKITRQELKFSKFYLSKLIYLHLRLKSSRELNTRYPPPVVILQHAADSRELRYLV